ncbi:DUF4136 domain-containing protein [Carboxylicivirga sp. N1Y90]|uniref:DUF4136 domain-containing protein n=1 Tax=Carboxylicivirga fragile TaxID=3417571 RepID=UPI003D343BA0|nr:DUF4136 domain-containing protein [Marinilabiliaceae bacterium N1Y90]
MKKIIPTAFIAALILMGCDSMSITTDYDHSVDFNTHQTFSFLGWHEDSDEIVNKFERDRWEKAFLEQFTKRGYKYVEDNGEIVVSLFLVVDAKTGKNAYTTHIGGGYGYGYGWGWGMGMGTSYTTIEEYDYNVGTLVVDVFDGQSKQLIWQGVGSDTVEENPKKRASKIPYVARNIMYKYPIKPGKR